MLIGYWKNAPAYGLLQVLGLVAVWMHGCLGLCGWLRLHRWWPRVASFLYPAAFALPILALLGFVEAGKAALARYANPGAAWTVATRLALGKAARLVPTMLAWRNRFLVIYAMTAAAALLVFALNALRRRGCARLTHAGGLEIAASRGLSLLEIDRQGGIPHASACSGRARCGTCRVRVLDGISNLSLPSEAEAELLRHLHLEAADIRLACQAILVGPAVTIERLVPADVEVEAAREPDAEPAAVAAP
jgi:adenylate cyclase